MDGHIGGYIDLAQRIDDTFHDVDNAVCIELRSIDTDYAALWMECAKLQINFPLIDATIEGDGEVSLTHEEHATLVRYLELEHKKEAWERKHIYIRGHTDNYSYLKKIGAI